MSSKRAWSKPVTPELRDRMRSSADACYLNASDLLTDAETLYKTSRWSRAAALAVLAEEEFSKAFMLRICAYQNRWDSNVHEALRKHSSKQGISQAMRDYLDLVVPNTLRVEELNKRALIPTQPGMFLSPKHLDPIMNRARQTFAKPLRDYVKQDALYVNVDEHASIVSKPNATSQSAADECIREARKFKAGVDLMSGDASAVKAWR